MLGAEQRPKDSQVPPRPVHPTPQQRPKDSQVPPRPVDPTPQQQHMESNLEEVSCIRPLPHW